MQGAEPDHYAVLGLDRLCTEEQIRTAYRLLARQYHPDLNPGNAQAAQKTLELNAAYAVLSDPQQRKAHDKALDAHRASHRLDRSSRSARNLTQTATVRMEELLRGTTLEIRVLDPGNPGGPETYELTLPEATAPGTRFRVPRRDGGTVTVRVQPPPDFRFKPRGSDLRCDLRIRNQRAAQGGEESLRGLQGNFLRLFIPPGTARGDILRIPGEGLPKPRGGRGDLLVRVVYTPEIRIRTRPTR